MAPTNRNLVRSLLKGLDILSTVADSEAGLRLVDIARRLDLKPPSAHNLVQTLLERRFLERVPGNRYRIGPAFLEVAGRQGAGTFMRRAERVLAGLAETFPHSIVTLAQISGDEIRFRLRMSPDRPGMMQRPAGMVFQPYANASGLVCLAFGAEDPLSMLRERFPFHEFAAHLWETPETLAAFLAEVRAKGYAAPPFPGQEAMRVAAPIMDAHGTLLGTIGLSTPWDAVRACGGEHALAQAVVEAADSLGG